MAVTRRFWRRAVFVLVPVTVAAIAVPIVIAKRTDDPAVIAVEAYLEALRDGDIEAAKTYIGDTSQLANVDDLTLLTSGALDGNWTVTDLESRPDGDQFLVDVTITAGERSTAGVFTVGADANGDMKVANPYVLLWLPYSGLGTFDVNGLRIERPTDELAGTTSEIYAVYPGSYTWFPETSGLYPSALETLLLLPGDNPYARVRTVMETTFELPAALAEEADRLLVEQLDACAASGEIRPPGCAFNGAPYDPLVEGINLEIDLSAYEYQGAPAWTITTYPEVEWWYVSGSIHAVEESPGSVELAVQGRRYYSDDDFTDLRISCDIDLESVWGHPGESGGLDLGATTGWSTCDELIED